MTKRYSTGYKMFVGCMALAFIMALTMFIVACGLVTVFCYASGMVLFFMLLYCVGDIVLSFERWMK